MKFHSLCTVVAPLFAFWHPLHFLRSNAALQMNMNGRLEDFIMRIFIELVPELTVYTISD